MSKVKIQGNATGTANFTIAAPATNTDRTITLPDADATLLTNAGGIINGVTQISNPTETGYASSLAETVSKATLRVKTHSTDSTLTTFGAISGGDAYIQRSNGSGTTQYNLRLNPYGGAVLTPNQPAFRGHVSPDQTTAGEMLSNWVISYNRGNCFSGGRFTCPAEGVYHVSAAIDASGSPSRLRICVNGNTKAMNEPTITNDGWETILVVTDVYVSANDYISLIVDNGTGSNPYHMGGGYWGWFNVHFVG